MSKEDDGFLEHNLQQEAIAPITTCSCPCCNNLDVPHQPANHGKIENARHACAANRSHIHGLFKPVGIGSTRGSVYALPPTKSSARCAAVQEARG